MVTCARTASRSESQSFLVERFLLDGPADVNLVVLEDVPPEEDRLVHVAAVLHAGGDGMTVPADIDHDVARLAKAFGSNVIIAGAGPEGSLRREATAAGSPTMTVEMGEAHRFQRGLIEQALIGVESVFAEYGLQTAREVNWPGWRTVIESSEKTWLRSDVGGIVDMHYDRGDIVEADEPIYTITNQLKKASTPVDAPFTALLVGILENPVVYPGNPLCNLVELDDDTRRAYRQSGPTMVAE